MAINMKTFDETILENWARRFQCPVSTLHQYGVTLLPDEKYADQKTLVFWEIGKHTFAIFDPSCADLLREASAAIPADTPFSGAYLQKTLGPDAFTTHDIGLLNYLSPPDLPDFTPASPYSLRQLTLADEAYLSTLHQNCTPAEVDDGFVEIDHELVYGCFYEDQLVAAASGYRIADFMDIGVLTHLGFRKQGLGKAVVGALCQQSMAQNIIPMYRYNSDNLGSRGVAQSLNFRHYFYSEMIVLQR